MRTNLEQKTNLDDKFETHLDENLVTRKDKNFCRRIQIT